MEQKHAPKGSNRFQQYDGVCVQQCYFVDEYVGMKHDVKYQYLKRICLIDVLATPNHFEHV
jgi:hypothetical protein